MAGVKSVSPHDSLGSNLIVQVKGNKVMRVLPLENAELNECWLSDKDRFSYEGLNSEDRLTRPMLKQDGRWAEVDWQTALEHVAARLAAIKSTHGAESLGVLGSPHSTLEELYLLQKLARGLGSENVDFRLRQSDFSADGKRAGVPWLGMNVAELGRLDRVLVVGSFLRKDHPLLAHRLRQAGQRRTQINILHSADDELLMRVTTKGDRAAARTARGAGADHQSRSRSEAKARSGNGGERRGRGGRKDTRAIRCRGSGGRRRSLRSSAPSRQASPPARTSAFCSETSPRSTRARRSSSGLRRSWRLSSMRNGV